jgi:hypothetical protein
VTVRLFHRGARLVFVVRRGPTGDQRWWSPHLSPPDWRGILTRGLALLGLPAQQESGGSALICRIGRVEWTSGRRCSMIALRFTHGSELKRRLVAAALLKAARYARPAP